RAPLGRRRIPLFASCRASRTLRPSLLRRLPSSVFIGLSLRQSHQFPPSRISRDTQDFRPKCLVLLPLLLGGGFGLVGSIPTVKVHATLHQRGTDHTLCETATGCTCARTCGTCACGHHRSIHRRRGE